MDDVELNDMLNMEEFEAIIWEKYVSPAFEELSSISEEIEMARGR
jgi:hypothetical protein